MDTQPYSEDEGSIRHEIQQLEVRLRSLQADRDSQQGHLSYTGVQKLTAVFLLNVVLVFSLLPAVLVFLDRWLQHENFKHYSRDLICQFDFLCSSAFPGYFFLLAASILIVFVSILIFARQFQGTILPRFEAAGKPVLVAITADQQKFRRQLILIFYLGVAIDLAAALYSGRVPGAELLLLAFLYWAALRLNEKKLPEIFSQNWFAERRDGFLRIAVIVFSQIALLFFLKQVNRSGAALEWGYVLLMILAAAVLVWQFRRLGKCYWLFTLGLLLFTFNMHAWRFSKIGDEYAFFYYAFNILNRQPFPEVINQFFSVQAVYGTHAYASSFVQAFFMHFFGQDHFGWHLSTIFPVLLSIPLFYHFLKQFLPERIALFAVSFIPLSAYLINFSKIGYNNLLAFFVMALILWTTGHALKHGGKRNYFLAGISMGFCFYSFPTALFFLPIPWLLILLYLPLKARENRSYYAHTALGLGLLLLPILFQPSFWGNMAAGATDHARLGLNWPSLVNHSVSNGLYAFLDYLWTPRESHYVVSSLLDPLTGVFLIPGLALAFVNLRRSRFMRFLLASFFLMLAAVGLVHGYDFPPITRMFMLLPWYFIFAAIGLDWLVRLFAGNFAFPGHVYRRAVLVLFIGIALFNFLQSTVVTASRYRVFYFEPTVMRFMQRDAGSVSRDPALFKNYLFLTDAQYTLDWAYMIQDVYGLPGSRAQLLRADVSEGRIPPEWTARLAEENLVVILPAFLPEEVRSSLAVELAGTQRAPCDLDYSDESGPLVQLWLSPRYQHLCRAAQKY